MAYQLKIKLHKVSKPPVWRRITVPQDMTFEMLHAVIQLCFGWSGTHMYRFSDKPFGSSFDIKPLFEEDLWMNKMEHKAGLQRIEEAAETRLCDIFKCDRNNLVYIYDFGDFWIHDIIVEGIIIGNEQHAVCLSGKGACPPEDCGGAEGYEYMKLVFEKEPHSDDAKKIREWLGMDEDETLDTNNFEKEEIKMINHMLENIDDYVLP